MNVASILSALKSQRLSLDLLIAQLEGEQASTVIPKEVLVNAMAKGIERFEGWYPGSRSYRNKNPFNVKHVGQPLAIGKDDKGFCVFATYEDGMATGKKMILNAARGLSDVYKPTMNLYQFFALYAPDSDGNNSKVYAESVAQNMSVDPAKFLLSQLV